MNIVKWNYGQYKSDNYSGHTIAIRVGTLTAFFSYNTIIAFRDNGHFVVRENDWGPTTGKHLNWLDDGDKSNRTPGEKFNQLLDDVLEKHQLLFD